MQRLTHKLRLQSRPFCRPVLFTSSGIPVTKSEFIQVYEKLNGQDTALYSPKSVDDYLELYTNFKLKVKEAESMGLDTAQSPTNQLAEYRKQLAQNYLYDKQITDKLVAEAYERLSKEVRVSRYLDSVQRSAAPTNAIIAHKKALEAYHRAKAANADFGSIAKEMSEDPSAKENRGDWALSPPYKPFIHSRQPPINAQRHCIEADTHQIWLSHRQNR